MKFVLVASIFALALGALAWVGLASAIPVVSVAEVQRPELQGQEVEVKEGQVRSILSYAPLRFTVGPRSGAGTTILVETPRPVPENFKLGIDVGLRGVYDLEKQIFAARVVTTKCPSKYEASEDAKKVEGLPGYPAAAPGVPTAALPASRS